MRQFINIIEVALGKPYDDNKIDAVRAFGFPKTPPLKTFGTVTAHKLEWNGYAGDMQTEYVLVDDGRVVGGLKLVENEVRWAGLLPEYRGRGLMTELYEVALGERPNS